MIGSGISQAMALVSTQISDALDAQILRFMNRINKVDPWVQQQAKAKIDKLKEVIEHGGHCPYSEVFIPPPNSTGVR